MITSKVRIIIPPQNAAEGDDPPQTVEGIKAMFGITDPPPANPDTDPASNNDPAKDTDTNVVPDSNADPNNPPAADPNADPNQDPNKDTNPTPQPDNTKAGQAFAALRVENTTYKKMLGGMAKILGIEDIGNTDAMTTKLQDLITKAEAKQSGIPEEVYKRLQTLESKDQMYTQNEVRQQAYFGFQKVKDQFKLDDNALNKFSDELLAQGINPFEQQVDLVLAYKDIHFNDLIEAAVQRGIKQEMERAANAANHSSTPNNKTGGQGVGDPEKITTVAQLDNWFNQNGMK